MCHSKCDNCGKEFPKEEIENHKLYCIFSLQHSEMENLIPCEICNQLINFDTYSEHIAFCNLGNNLPNILNISNIIHIPLIQPTNNVGETEANPTLEANLNENLNNFIDNTQFFIQNINNINNYLNQFNQTDNYENLINLDNNNEIIGIQNIDNILTYSGEEIDCPICTEKTLNSYKTTCNHLFCRECIGEWLKDNKKCPICMKEFIE